MYTIYANGQLIYNPISTLNQITRGRLSKNMNDADYFTFTVSPENTAGHNLTPLVTYIEVFDNDHRIFRGRITNPDANLRNVMGYECEGELAFLNDSIVRPYVWNTGGVADYLRFLIANHNEQADPQCHFTVRNVTVTETALTGNIVRSSESHVSTFEELRLKLFDALGGVMMLERIGNTTFIDYVEVSPNVATQPVDIGMNIIDLNYLNRGEAVKTALFPLGAMVMSDYDETGDYDDNTITSGNRIGIAEVNDGIDFIFDQNAVNRFGWKFATATFDDAYNPEVIMERGWRALADMVNPRETLEVNLFDLSRVDPFWRRIRHLDYIDINNPTGGIQARLLIVRMRLNLLDASMDTVGLGSESGSLSRGLQRNRLETANLVRNAVTSDQVRQTANNINRDTQVNVNNTVNSAVNNATNQINNNVTNQINDATNQINNSVSQSVSTLGNRITAVENSVSTLQSNVSTLQTLTGGHTTSINTINTNINGINTRITSVENSVSELSDALESLEARIYALEND